MSKLKIYFFISFLFLGKLSSFSQEDVVNSNKNFKTFSKNEKWGFMKDNQVAIPAKFDYVTDFSENFALVKENGKWGYIDTLGNWFIEPQFDKAQPVQFGYAFVQKNSKTGLLKFEFNEMTLESSYKEVLVPIYDKVKEDYNYYTLYQNNKKGYLSKVDSTFLPAVFDSIIDGYSWISATKDNEFWDLYYKGKLVLENMQSPFKSENVINYSEKIIVEKYGKFGIFEVGKGWIVEPKYAKIEKLDFPSYKTKNGEFNFIFALHSKDIPTDSDPYFEDELSEMSASDLIDTIYLAKGDGSTFTNQFFNSIDEKYNFYDDIIPAYALKASQNENTSFIFPDFSVKNYSLTSIYSQAYNWHFGNSENKGYIFDNKIEIIDSFYRVERYKEFANLPMEDYSEEFYDLSLVEIEITEEPFLLVFRKNGENEEKAIYDLTKRKIISPWIFDENNSLVIKREYFLNNLVYTYQIDNKLGFFTNGLENGTEMKYHEQIVIFEGNLYVKIPNGENSFTYELYSMDDNEIKLISTEYEVLQASDFISEGFTNDEIGEFDLIYINSFKTNFLILKKNNKYGLVSLNGKIIDAIYDTLYQSENDSYFIHSKLNGKFGRINLQNGNFIDANYDSEIILYQSLSVNGQELFYANMSQELLNKKTGDFVYRDFILTENNKIILFDLDLIFPRKVKKMFGLYGYTEYSDPDLAFEHLEANYRFLEQSQFKGVYRAKGKNKKLGIINLFGDTLVPFKYSKCTPFIFSNQVSVYKVFKGKKVGLYDLELGEIIPAIYDEIEPSSNQYEYPDFFQSRLNKKLAMHNKKGEKLCENLFEKITFRYTYIDDNYYDGDQSFGYFECIKDGKIYIISEKSKSSDFKKDKLIAYDFIQKNIAYVKRDKFIDSYKIPENTFIESQELNDLVLNGIEYNIVSKNGKFGAVDHFGNQLVPFEYDFATFMESRDEVMIGYQNGVKYYIYVVNNERFTEDQW
jgi:hypothetical protein